MRAIRDHFRQKTAASHLRQIVKTASPLLSNDNHLETVTQALEEKLEQFQQDVKVGKFSNRTLATP